MIQLELTQIERVTPNVLKS